MNSLNIITQNMQLFYQNVFKIYDDKTKSVSDSQNRWLQIAKLINDNCKLITNNFDEIFKNSDRENIKLDYNTSLAQINNQIENEKNMLVKNSFIILGLHQIVYDLMSLSGNYYMILSGKQQMNIIKNDLNYYINISQKVEQNVFFHAFILVYASESLFTKSLYVGVDFEYTIKKIQLAQLCFEHSYSLKSMISLVNPNELDAATMETFIQLIMCNRLISKILHGADSLDIEYVYPILLAGDRNKIIKFTKSMIDTRFLCEYYKVNHGAEPEKKCAIYSDETERSAIYYFGVVSESQQNALAELLRIMPDPDIREWNIHKIQKSMIMYAQYDVLFLKYFYYRIIHVATNDQESDLAKKNIMDLYKKTLNQLTQWVYMENKKITELRDDCKKDVDLVNNYFVKKPTGILKMIDIYNKVSGDINITNPTISIDNLLKVNHFKKPIELVIKRMVYGHISRSCNVFKNKTTIWTDKLSNQFIFDFFVKYSFENLLAMFKEINKVLEVKIKKIC